MIKIEIGNSLTKEQEYVDSVFLVVNNRVNILKKSIDHLRGIAIDFNGVNFDSLRSITRKIINKLENRNDAEDLYLIINYNATVTNYIVNDNNLENINLQGINDLLNFLTVNHGYNLKNLLKCKSDQLFSLNDKLLDDYGIINEIDKTVLKFAFDYDGFKEISSPIKRFFRDNNFVKYCPYCNLNEVEYRETINGQPVTTHQLDHFFDKATFPLLSYSMYNLIPSDSTCNTINKFRTEFTDVYHLNPYFNGFGNSMSFIPVVIGSRIEVQEIRIVINEAYLSPKYRQLIGDNIEINENDENGNINVFKILGKYRDRKNKAKKILREIQKVDKGLIPITKYLRLLNLRNRKAYYLKWYFENIDTPFKYNEFNNEAYSKFNRDIHDYYYSNNSNITNRYIRELIRDNIS